MVQSTMMTTPLTVTQLLRHGARVHAEREVVTWQGESARTVTFADTNERVERLAKALDQLGVGEGDVVGTFMWNNQEHLEAYFAVPCKGAVLHTLNIRLAPEQLAFVIKDGGDTAIIIDDSLVPLLARVKDDLDEVEHIIVVGDGDASALDREVLRYDDLLAEQTAGYDWPELDENTAAMMCHTSGTTGNPKGVVYSHRSQWTHTMGAAAGGLHSGDGDRTLVVVPQFHANAWGLIYICWAMGSDILQPGPFLQPEPLSAFIAAEKPTFSAGVPTVWNGLLAHGSHFDIELASIRRIVVGGAAVPRAMADAYLGQYGIEIVQAWGMTEMSPVGTVAIPPSDCPQEQRHRWRAKTGRIVPGVDMRIVADDGTEQPWDGKAIGEVQVRGPWITAGYHNAETPEKFSADGWLKTGDVAVIEPTGFMQIVDRTKDVIKSGGEWISSVDLENAIVGHPDVVEAAVIGVPDQKWDERPLACVVVKGGAEPTPDGLSEYLQDHVAKWWIPERWTFIDEVPKTSVGKYDKKILRGRHNTGAFDIQMLEVGSPGVATHRADISHVK